MVVGVLCVLHATPLWAQQAPPEPEPEVRVTHAGWVLEYEGRRGDALRGVRAKGPAGWQVSAEVVSLREAGFLARGRVRISGPEQVYVITERVQWASGVLTAERGGALVGQGWTVQAKKIEVDVARVEVRMEGVLGAADPR